MVAERPLQQLSPIAALLKSSGGANTLAHAYRLNAALKEANIPTKLFAAKNTEHSKLNDDLGLPEDPATKALYDFIAQTIKR
jgi:arylformamidase